MEKRENEETLWKLFTMTGEPGYYMLYKRVKDGSVEDE